MNNNIDLTERHDFSEMKNHDIYKNTKSLVSRRKSHRVAWRRITNENEFNKFYYNDNIWEWDLTSTSSNFLNNQFSTLSEFRITANELVDDPYNYRLYDSNFNEIQLVDFPCGYKKEIMLRRKKTPKISKYRNYHKKLFRTRIYEWPSLQYNFKNIKNKKSFKDIHSYKTNEVISISKRFKRRKNVKKRKRYIVWYDPNKISFWFDSPYEDIIKNYHYSKTHNIYKRKSNKYSDYIVYKKGMQYHGRWQPWQPKGRIRQEYDSMFDRLNWREMLINRVNNLAN